MLGHDQESKFRVSGYEDQESFSRAIFYDVGLAAAKAVADNSASCSQDLQVFSPSLNPLT